MGLPFPLLSLPHPHSIKSNYLFIVGFCWNLKQNIFMCIPIILRLNSEMGVPFWKSKLFFYCAILKHNIFIYLLIIIEIQIYESGSPCPHERNFCGKLQLCEKFQLKIDHTLIYQKVSNEMGKFFLYTLLIGTWSYMMWYGCILV